MPVAHNGNYRINYDVTIGSGDETLVLIAGLGEQIGSVEYPLEQCNLFGQAGFKVVRIDNRDSGLSGPTESEPETPYSLLDMADDIAAVIHDLGDEPVHVLGASMGGFIARFVAIRHPGLVKSLTVVMSGSGAEADEDGPQVNPEVRERSASMLETLPRTEAIASSLETWRWLWGQGYPFPEAFVRERLEYAFDRAYRPDGIVRQIGAVIATKGLWDAHRQIQCPTLVVHGGEDPYFSIEHGEAVAKSIPDAELWVDSRMGHIMHQEQWQELANRVRQLAQRT